MGSNANPRTGRWRRSWIAAAATLAAAIMASTLYASPAWAAFAENKRTLYLGGADTQGGKACVQRDIFILGEYYDTFVGVSHGSSIRIWLGLVSGNYVWTTCVIGVPGQKGWYYSTTRLLGIAPVQYDKTVTTSRFLHSVGANEELYSSMVA